MADRPNILFLLSDEHSYRCFGHLDAHGEGEPVDTPTLDALAARATVFHQTYCQVALCTPSRICLLTGRSPMQSGGWTNESYLKPGNPTLPQTLAEAGYSTCLVGKMHLGGNRQFVGFQHRPYGDLAGKTGHQLEPILERHAELEYATWGWIRRSGVTEIPESKLQEQVVARETIAFLREHRHRRPDQPWFVCSSFSRPHWPATVPSRWFDRYWPDRVTEAKIGAVGASANHPIARAMGACQRTEQLSDEMVMRTRAAYFGCVSYLDEILGDLLAVLERDGFLENTVVVYASDHGELAGEHGLWGKGSWHEASSRTPWMVQLPDHRSGSLEPNRLQTPVSLADLYPTLCGLVGVAAPEHVDGMDLSPSVHQGREPDRGPVLITNWSEPHAEHRHCVLREGSYKYVRCRSPLPDLLFDLQADPHEQRDLLSGGLSEHAAVAERMMREIDRLWSPAAADEQRDRDQAEAERNALPIEMRHDICLTGNVYLMRDNRLVAADTPLYDPATLTDKPHEVFADWPGELV